MLEKPYLFGSDKPLGAFNTNLRIHETLRAIRPYSMIPQETLIDLAHQVYAILALNVRGDFVECGVWNGGASFLIADILRREGVRDRKVWLFDSFEGHPPPAHIDGKRVLNYVKDKKSPWYLDSCRSSVEAVQQTSRDLGLDAFTEFVPGWFDKTLPAFRERIGPISLLRIDGNWYASDKCCLENLYDQVVDGGLVTVNTYYTYEGSTIALHEFLGERRISYPIEPVFGPPSDQAYFLAAVFRKGVSTWKWFHRTFVLDHYIKKQVPIGDSFVLIDEEKLGGSAGSGRQRIPFLERDGKYWGVPSNDDDAIADLERLRKAGAGYLAVAWPSFWWLTHFEKFSQYVKTKFPCLLENDVILLFDLKRSG